MRVDLRAHMFCANAPCAGYASIDQPQEQEFREAAKNHTVRKYVTVLTSQGREISQKLISTPIHAQ